MADEQTTAEPWTIGRLLTWTTDFLRGKGADSPRLDAEVLLAHARGCQRIELYTAFAEEPAEAVRTAFRELVSRRAMGTPVAYLVGQREFFSLSFEVTPDVLIPRPETEQLVVRALDLAKEMKSAEPLKIADVGTGSGAIAVCIAKHFENCSVTAIDISPAALDVARRNAEKHGVAERIKFVAGDLFSTLSSTEKYSLVLSNPPYVSSEEMADLAPDVRDYEPHLALDGGEHGTEVIERLIAQSPGYLLSGAWLLLEVGATNAERVEALISQDSELELQETLKDIAGLPRVVQAKRK
ncbi:peptide chain release factor N(5)-glutamine methyltransferase [Bythopirellula polymerisocia]|uniref:Release factor glutamine methyltransferase n=1 Tax=Bythopirellula polymerisocia TaxID=2528003 RepID=A0A5C6CGL1_9BACT|nr:peptide chain release factor N(5)-glutamine methyltransferase [Bythopirellula polymerisocia]TWU23790.1 Release factor glutamine methyltransferase [Bythopirellula polymerisocia]